MWHGELADGVSTLVQHLGYKPEEYKMGRYLLLTVYYTEPEVVHAGQVPSSYYIARTGRK